MAKRTYRPTPQQLDAVWECLEREIDWSQLREIPDSSAMAWRYVAVLVRRHCRPSESRSLRANSGKASASWLCVHSH